MPPEVEKEAERVARASAPNTRIMLLGCSSSLIVIPKSDANAKNGGCKSPTTDEKH